MAPPQQAEGDTRLASDKQVHQVPDDGSHAAKAQGFMILGKPLEDLDLLGVVFAIPEVEVWEDGYDLHQQGADSGKVSSDISALGVDD